MHVLGERAGFPFFMLIEGKIEEGFPFFMNTIEGKRAVSIFRAYGRKESRELSFIHAYRKKERRVFRDATHIKGKRNERHL